jgi:gas vesicle protein
MKFTKQDAIKELEAKIPAKDKELDLGRTISEAVDNSIELIGEESEMELSDFVEKVWKQVKTSIGLTHSENSKVAQKLQSQLDELKNKIEGKQAPPTPKPEDIQTDDPAMQAILDKLNKMESKLKEKDKEKAIADKRSQLVAKMKESIKDEDWITSYLAEINITEEMDVEAKAKDYIAFYNKTAAGGSRRSTTPRKTGEGDNEDADTKNALEKAKALMQQRDNVMGSSPVETKNV